MIKAQIVQRLLDEGKITAEEAVVLLTPTIIQHTQERIGPPYGDQFPTYPVTAYPWWQPFTTSCVPESITLNQ